MPEWPGFIEWRTVAAPPLRQGDVTITPLARALIVRWPGGGYVWNRPWAVEVERAGHIDRHAIHDVTRLLQLALLLASGVAAVLAVRRRRG